MWHSAVSWSLAVAALRAAGFLLVLPLALRRLSADELGLWYLYASIAEFCAFAELGRQPFSFQPSQPINPSTTTKSPVFR